MGQMQRVALAACAAAAMIVPAAGLAQGGPDSSTYLGGTVGQSQAKDFCTDVSGAGTTCDDKYTTWSILVGYQWNRNLGFEIGYRDLGQAHANGPGGSVTSEAKAFELLAMGILPVGDRFSVYGKFGAYFGESDVVTSVPGVGVATDHDSNIDLTYGVGVQFELTKQFGLRAEWQRYQDMSTSNIDVDAISIGLIWRFR
ncbi:MAG TPA: outer membrane beta-barrel protein [Burkholderiales bacterium]